MTALASLASLASMASMAPMALMEPVVCVGSRCFDGSDDCSESEEPE